MFWIAWFIIIVTQYCNDVCCGIAKSMCVCDLEHNTRPGDIGQNEFELDSEVNDIVQMQYSLLPYPPLSRNELLNEKEYYKAHVTPLLFSYQLQLEYLNHYLFQGGEDFEYVVYSNIYSS